MTIHTCAFLNSRRSCAQTPNCIVGLDTSSTTVKTRAWTVSSFVPGGGQTGAAARMVKKAANSPLKNMNSEPSQIMTPTASSCGCSATG